MLIGVIADDMTGASDVALMLARGGLSTVQVIGVPGGDMPEAEAVVVALKSRTAPVEEAVSTSLAAARALRKGGARQILFKYCSTFDSTAKGNIGPVADALLAETGSDFALVCPAFPATGRTIYQGYLFVNGVPLDESPMKDHPLTPMRDANLMRLMAAQSGHRVGLIPLAIVRRGAAAIREAITGLKQEGITYGVADAAEDDDLHRLGEAIRDHVLITGGSGIALGLPAWLKSKSGLRRATFTVPSSGSAAILAGSCSAMTRRQIAAAIKAGIAAIEIDPFAVKAGTVTAASLARLALERQEPVLVYSSAEPDNVARVQAQLGRAEAGAMIEDVIAGAARHLVESGIKKLIVAGGETSGAVVQALHIRALAIGPEIDPGVPWMQVREGDEAALGLTLTLKSGNFGAEDFFIKALNGDNVA